ncbi:DUF2975 domain-containing protein [Compostibacter hankyongensis]|uniref:DUF2975 domain-containing protein n=1 Tax=Compostibacter hankyongensis TaxID=1007089 RepID=A0ABP8FG65_9BACT
MKSLGVHSLSSVLRIIVSVCFYAQAAFFVVLLLIITGQLWLQGERQYTWPVAFTAPAVQKAEKVSQGISAVSLKATEGQLSFNGKNHWQLELFTMLGIALVFGTSLFVTLQLKRILSSFVRDKPFLSQNAGRIKAIGIALLLYSVVSAFFGWFYVHFLNTRFAAELNVHFTLHWDFVFLLMGLLVLVIGEIFRIGAQLQEEKALTI